MRKIIAVVMTIMTALFACGCTGRPANNVGSSSTYQDKTESSESSVISVPDTVVELDFGIEETVLVEQDDMLIKAYDLAYDELYKTYLLKISAENKTDKEISISAMEVGVNSFIVTCMFSMKVPAGETKEEVLDISQKFMEAAGIRDVMEVELSLRIVETDSYSTLLETQMIRIPTTLEETSQQEVPEGVLLMDQEGIKIYGLEYDDTSSAESGVVLYLVNDSESKVVISCSRILLDGKEVDGTFIQALPAGYGCVKAVTISKSSLEKAGITAPAGCTMTMDVLDAEGFHTLFTMEPVDFRFE